MYIECNSGRRPLSYATLRALSAGQEVIRPIPVPPEPQGPSCWRSCLGQVSVGEQLVLAQQQNAREDAIGRRREVLVGLRQLLESEYGGPEMLGLRNGVALTARLTATDPGSLNDDEFRALVVGCAKQLRLHALNGRQAVRSALPEVPLRGARMLTLGYGAINALLERVRPRSAWLTVARGSELRPEVRAGVLEAFHRALDEAGRVTLRPASIQHLAHKVVTNFRWSRGPGPADLAFDLPLPSSPARRTPRKATPHDAVVFHTPSPDKRTPVRSMGARSDGKAEPMLSLRSQASQFSSPIRYDVLKALGQAGRGGVELVKEGLAMSPLNVASWRAREVSVAGAAARPVDGMRCAEAHALLSVTLEILLAELGPRAAEVPAVASLMASPSDWPSTVGGVARIVAAAGWALIQHESAASAAVDRHTRDSAAPDQPLTGAGLQVFADGVVKGVLDRALEQVVIDDRSSHGLKPLPAGVVQTIGVELDFDPATRRLAHQQARAAIDRASLHWCGELTARQAIHAIESAMLGMPAFAGAAPTRLRPAADTAIIAQLQRQARLRTGALLQTLQPPPSAAEARQMVAAAWRATQARAADLSAALQPRGGTDLVAAGEAMERVIAAAVRAELDRPRLLALGQAWLEDQLRLVFPNGFDAQPLLAEFQERFDAEPGPTRADVNRLAFEIINTFLWARRPPAPSLSVAAEIAQ